MTNATETRPPAEIPNVFVEAPPDVQTEATPSPGAYAMGYSNIFMELLGRRSAPRNAAHLLPLLLPGMTLLDLGCGPGSITTGLAKAVHPGRTHGVDLNEEQLGLARRRAQELGLENLEFHQSNALRLPFPDHHFDAVHCHGFLMHSPCIKEQLTEILRVLKPRGILASRDMDVPTSFITPALLSHKIFGMLAETIRREGGDPWMGRRLKVFFLNAGLEEVETGFGADYFTQPEDVEFLGKFLLEWGLSKEFQLKTGGSHLDFNRSREQVERWSRHPGAVGCFHFGHAVGRKPESPDRNPGSPDRNRTRTHRRKYVTNTSGTSGTSGD